ncbi:Uncharacterized protein OBRU01_13288 [Operophtera brumata]|uniref:IRS-type PTB domain-containing protein n=1 Tax=Operophtera brumata TaxID=104452 RepID=A0A0L7L136_OPEBR|nr:Uncharacterized protein OBRU01_13288 [Operophtera brumata]
MAGQRTENISFRTRVTESHRKDKPTDTHCVHLQLYRDSRARWGGGCKAALSLQQYLGCEAGFTLDKHSNTLALVCTDLVAVLAFETRERLMQWQSVYYLYRRLFIVTLLFVPGEVEGRFCFEGGSHCGKGEGLHVLITDQAKDIANDFDLASRGRLSPRRRPNNTKRNDAESPKSYKNFRPDTRLSELNTIDHSVPPMDLRLYEDPCTVEEASAISPYWLSMRRQFQDMGHGDTASVNETIEGTETTPWGSGTGKVTLERCMSCMSKLGALSRSSTAALTPGAKHFSPAWTMDALHEAYSDASRNAQTSDNPSGVVDKSEDVCRCPVADRMLGRPPKPTRLELNLNRKPPMPLPTQTCCYAQTLEENKTRVGPYENYDVPKLASVEINGEYYDTPKRLKESLNNELFKITKNSTPNAVILKKPCGCLLKFGRRRKEPTVIDTDDNIQQVACPCQRVTDWANSWIKLPYCRKNTVSSDNLAQNKDNYRQNAYSALYATIDLSLKTRRKTHPIEPHEFVRVESKTVEVDEGPLANYENLNFALSLEYYENAKDLLRRAGVTQLELNAISANLIPPELPAKTDKELCKKCGHPPAGKQSNFESLTTTVADDYLMMEPKSLESRKIEQIRTPLALASAGYTSMSPIGGIAVNSPKQPARKPVTRLLDEKSASNPTLCADDEAIEPRQSHATSDRADRRKRSSSADSSRFLEDVKEFEGSVGSCGSSSSIETLRNLVLNETAPCHCTGESGKLSDADSSEASHGRSRAPPPARQAGSVPGTAGNRDSSSSNDSGVSTCSLRRGMELAEFELPTTTAATRRHYRSARRAAACYHASLPRRSKSTDPLRDIATLQRVRIPAKSSSAEAEVPVLSVKSLRGIIDTHSTSSGTSDMSDYIETLSICSSHSSTDTPITMSYCVCILITSLTSKICVLMTHRVVRETTSTLRPRSGKEYLHLTPRRPPHAPVHSHLYSNLP